MRYFILRRDPEIEWGVRGHIALPDGETVLAGRVISGPAGTFVATVDHPAEEPPLHLLGGDVLLLSQQIIHGFLAAGVDNFQSWPARLENPDLGLAWDGYALFNALGMVAAVDMATSRFDTLMFGDPEVPSLVDFEEVVLVGARCADLRMFRVPESPSLLFIDEVVVHVLREQRPPGGWGITVQEVRVR